MAKKNGSLSGLSVGELQRELRRREKGVGSLLRRREKMLAKIKAIEADIEAHGGTTRGGLSGRKRPKNEMNLVEALAKVLDGKTMGVTEVSQAVQKAGYQTTSPSFRVIVNQALINSGKFKRVGRGQYTVK